MKDNSESESRIVRTCGEDFADGSAIELVDPDGSCKPSLLFWNGKDAIIKPELEIKGVILSTSRSAPKPLEGGAAPGAIEQRGTTARLRDDIKSLIESRGLPTLQAKLATAWILTTWVADCLCSPLTLAIFGSSMAFAVQLLLLFGCLAYHPLVTTGISREALCRLRERMRLTLLLNQPDLPSKVRLIGVPATTAVFSRDTEVIWSISLVRKPSFWVQNLRPMRGSMRPCGGAAATGNPRCRLWTGNRSVRSQRHSRVGC